jgi:hypothetical protein
MIAIDRLGRKRHTLALCDIYGWTVLFGTRSFTSCRGEPLSQWLAVVNPKEEIERGETGS